MRFREEVLAKIFTYITVVLLLGIVIFEAWTVQNERSKRKDAEETIASVQDSLQEAIDLNASLQEKNENLEAFQKEWESYAAFVESSDILALKTDLFVRPDMIPKEAIAALEEKMRLEEGQDDAAADEGEEEAVEQTRLNPEDFTFDNPDGEDIFLPLSMGVGSVQNCLVYTAAFHAREDAVIELLYEIDFEKQRSVIETDENGEIAWKCVCYNAGEGWIGIAQEEGKE